MKLNKSIIKLIISIVLISFAAAPMALADEQTVVTGTLEQTGAGFVIKAGDGDYLLELEAGQDVSALVGKSVKALGTVSEGDTGKVIKAKIVNPSE